MITKLQSGHDFYTENYKGGYSAKRYNFHTNHIQNYKGHKTEKNVEGVTVHNQILMILLFVPSFVKLSQTVSKL